MLKKRMIPHRKGVMVCQEEMEPVRMDRARRMAAKVVGVGVDAGVTAVPALAVAAGQNEMVAVGHWQGLRAIHRLLIGTS